MPRPGLRYKDVDLGPFGQPRGTVWEVEAITHTADGIPHARLRNVADRMRSRHIAVSVLLDKAFYAPLPAPDVALAASDGKDGAL